MITARYRHRIAVLVSERNARLFSRFGPRLVMRVVSATLLSLHAEVVSSPAQAARGVVFNRAGTTTSTMHQSSTIAVRTT